MMICIPSLRTTVSIPNHVLNSHYYYPSSAYINWTESTIYRTNGSIHSSIYLSIFVNVIRTNNVIHVCITMYCNIKPLDTTLAVDT